VLGVKHTTIQRDLAQDVPESGTKRTTGSDETEARRAAVAAAAAAEGVTLAPTGKYRIIYADPPWDDGFFSYARISLSRRFDGGPLVSTLILPAENRRSIAWARPLRLAPPTSGMPSNTAGA
jgi:hypothetical protein